jgi:plastocyanin
MSRIVIAILLTIGTLTLKVPTVQGAREWTLLAGGVTQDGAAWSNAYHPRSAEIGVGDRVTWRFDGFHTVTFLGGEKFPDILTPEGNQMYANPKVFFPVGDNTYDGTGYHNSGTPPDAKREGGVYKPAPFTYSLTFPKAGRFQYVCVIHGPGMGGTIIVKDTVSRSPAAVLQQARREQQATLNAGRAAFARHRPVRQGKSVLVPMIGDLKAGYTILRFTREPLVVSRGTQVTWAMRDPFEIHTVTFNSGQELPPFVIPQPQSQGPPKLLFNPKVAAPTPHRSYDGTGYVNSGILFPSLAPGNVPKRYSLTFTKAGRYDYWCAVHVVEGMKGTIVVR